jgi:hypothetical protein
LFYMDALEFVNYLFKDGYEIPSIYLEEIKTQRLVVPKGTIIKEFQL